MRIAIVEDDPDIREILSFNLQAEGFRVTEFADGEKALDALLNNPPDLVILDLMLPGVNGLDIARTLRSEPHTRSLPLLMLTARSQEMDIVRGFQLGADDYVTKPFRLNELLARVQALLRRSGKLDEQVLNYRNLNISFSRHAVTKDDQHLKLTPKEMKLLHALYDAKGSVLSREQLLATVWGYDYFGDPRTVDVHIRRLREKLTPYQDLIETVKGFGYRLKPEAVNP